MRTKAFTLVEMLIVMGIIIILMAVGIASGRFAIRRANRIEHENATEQIYQALQSYYSDNREYPPYVVPEDLVELNGQDSGYLTSYIDDFEGGSEATYTYHVDGTGQKLVICVTLGGAGDENSLGIYCTGNAIGDGATPEGWEAPNTQEIEYDEDEFSEYSTTTRLFIYGHCSDWDPNIGWGPCTAMYAPEPV